MKGNYRDSTGLHPIDTSISPGPDGPDDKVLQQISGQRTIFYIDSPAVNMTLLPGETVDSDTKVENFTAHFCSIVTTVCYTQKLYIKLVIKPGGILSLSDSSAGLGMASTTF